jgi:hypothetical protein
VQQSVKQHSTIGGESHAAPRLEELARRAQPPGRVILAQVP